MTLSLYNTRTRQKEPFAPLQPGRVTMYVCGPTVYSFPHIGNARPAVVFDVLARLLRTRYQLVYARNITDIDDKINRAAAAEGVPIGEIAARYAHAYHADMRALGNRLTKFYHESMISKEIIELFHGQQMASVVADAALKNPESRGAHFRRD